MVDDTQHPIPQAYPLTPTYTPPNGIHGFDVAQVPLPAGFDVAERWIIEIPPGGIGGNHKHPRAEAMLALGNLRFVWLDATGKRHESAMRTKGQLTLLYIPPMLPHAVVNLSTTNPSYLLEWANDHQHDVEAVDVI